MKNNYLIFIVFTALFPLLAESQSKPMSPVKGELENLDGIASVEILECDTFFLEKYLIRVEQPVDHTKKNGATFSQRVYVGFKGITKPTVFVTEGYDGGYAASPRYLNELCPLLDANLVLVEHRYFGESIPDTTSWKFHTIMQSANDHHRINQLMKQILTGKYVSTGISKGGQTTMYYKYYFPGDCDVWVPYVAPLNFSISDERVNPFINNVGSADCRKKVRDFQLMVLEREQNIMVDFAKAAAEKGYHFTIVNGIDAAFEYVVLEYPFAFWQWGNIPCESIPVESDPDSLILQHLLKVSLVEYFADEGIRKYWPFFYQALTQIGYYDYDTTGLGKYLNDVEDFTYTFSAPPGSNPKFKPQYMKKVDKYLKKKSNNMIFLYGEYDPWSSTAFVPIAGKTNVLKIVKEGGSHSTRISNLPENERAQVLDTLEKWLEIKVNR
jgi:hypothetical protein